MDFMRQFAKALVDVETHRHSKCSHLRNETRMSPKSLFVDKMILQVHDDIKKKYRLTEIIIRLNKIMI